LSICTPTHGAYERYVYSLPWYSLTSGSEQQMTEQGNKALAEVLEDAGFI